MIASSDGWELANHAPQITAREVHIWRAPLESDAELEQTLSAEEQSRANRFYFDRDRERFIAARGLLRTILGKYLAKPGKSVRFVAGAHGKPEIEPGVSDSLRFNLSHSAELMLLAVTRIGEVGVDLEMMRDDVPFETLAEHHFAPEQASSLRLLPPANRAAKFYDIWTATEAQLKASGIGLLNGTNIVEPDRWSLHKLTPAPGYAGALAVEGEDVQLKCWSWQK
jgi:4'-phosphopantetheinyl transferase